MHSRIFLIGFMGSGKSTLGSRLAHRIGYDFVDMDHLIEETAGMTIPGIFEEHGETVFRKWERDILQELCRRERIVISTGGGAPCHGDMISVMNANGDTIYLKMSPSALRDRLVHAKTRRPLIEGKSWPELLDYISSTLEKREEFYNQARFTVDGVHLHIDTLITILRSS